MSRSYSFQGGPSPPYQPLLHIDGITENVGIRTANPQQVLDVVGTFRASDTVTANNFIVKTFDIGLLGGVGAFREICDVSCEYGAFVADIDIVHNNTDSSESRTYSISVKANAALPENSPNGYYLVFPMSSTGRYITRDLLPDNDWQLEAYTENNKTRFRLVRTFGEDDSTSDNKYTVIMKISENQVFPVTITPLEGSGNLGDSGQSPSTIPYPTTFVTQVDDKKLGIGTINPSYAVDIRGSNDTHSIMRIGDRYSERGGKIYFGESNAGVGRNATIDTLATEEDVSIWTHGPGSVGIGTDLKERLRLDPDGRLGLGTSNPTYSADFQTPTREDAILRIGDTSNLEGGRIYFGDSNHGVGRDAQIDTLTAEKDVSLWTEGTGSVGIATDMKERLRIDPNGNLGIGTSNPTYVADVQTSTPQDAVLRIGDTSNLEGGRIYFGDSNHGVGRDAQIDTLRQEKDVSLWTEGIGSIGLVTDSRERMRIDSQGNMGIGASNPSYKVDIQAPIPSDAILRIGGTSNFAGGTLYFGNSNHGIARGAGFDTLSNADDVALWTFTPGSLGFVIDSQEKMRITPIGDVGIGTENPLYLVDLQGSNADSSVLRIRDTDDRAGRIYLGDENHGLARSFAKINTLTDSNDVSLWTNGTTGNLGFATQLTERARFTPGGSFGLGIKNPTALFHTVGPSRIGVQDGIDGGSNQGIYMWEDNDSNWAIYMASASSNSIAGTPAVDGHNFREVSLRMRASTSNQGFVWENRYDERCMSLNAADKSCDLVGTLM